VQRAPAAGALNRERVYGLDMIDRTPRRPLRSAERAASILEAAARVFARSGYAATSMDDVAAEAGITKLIVYRHFNSKRDLYLAVLGEVAERLRKTLSPAPGGLRDADLAATITDVSAILLATFGVARSWPDGFRLVFRQAVREPEFAGLADQLMESLAAGAERQIAMVPDPGFRQWMGRLIAAVTVEGMLTWLDVGDPARDEEMAERLTLAISGLVGSQRWDDPG
jgi:AcrR family transcriptional regulator